MNCCAGICAYLFAKLTPHSLPILTCSTIKDLQSLAVQGSKPVEKPVEEQPIALNPRKKIPFTLVEKTTLSRDSRKLKFALQSPKHVLGLPVGKHMFFYATVNGEQVMRAYTPSSSNDLVGFFELVVKVYFANENPRFPDGGKMSQVRHRP